MRKLITAFAAIGLIAALGFAGPTFGATKNHGSSDTACGEDGNINTTPTILWPPNHKDVTITFTYTTGEDDAMALELFENPHNEIADDGSEINGTGNTDPGTDSLGGAGADGMAGDEDGSNNGTVVVNGSARAERSGHKNLQGGRVYEFDYEAQDDGGNSDDSCASDPTVDGDGILVFVPHDCRGGAKSGACHN
jgi:hypothetical protein